MNLTNNQLNHRQYLCSPIWKLKRDEALKFYGCICSRCKEYGNDVHHKTYDRVGGNELMSDLEVVCRDCHKAHHKIHRFLKQTENKERKGINRFTLYRFLTAAQKKILIKDFNLTNEKDLDVALSFSDNNKLIMSAARMLGFDFFYGTLAEKRTINPRSKHYIEKERIKRKCQEDKRKGRRDLNRTKTRWISLKDFNQTNFMQ